MIFLSCPQSHDYEYYFFIIAKSIFIFWTLIPNVHNHMIMNTLYYYEYYFYSKNLFIFLNGIQMKQPTTTYLPKYLPKFSFYMQVDCAKGRTASAEPISENRMWTEQCFISFTSMLSSFFFTFNAGWIVTRNKGTWELRTLPA